MATLKSIFDFDPENRAKLLAQASVLVNDYYDDVEKLPVAAKYDRKEVQAYINQLLADQQKGIKDVLKNIMEGLQKYAVQTSHPSYYGLYNPRTTFASVLSEMLTATTNPQLAAWSHNPFSNEVERYLIHQIGQRIGYQDSDIDGIFCNGGAEANLTATLCAMQAAYPQYAKEGLFGIQQKPKIYASSESHHSVLKAAKIVGLGFDAVIEIPVTSSLKMDTHVLEQRIKDDIASGYKPLMIVATAGTTGTGVIDSIVQATQISSKYNLWCHVDGAYGGAVIFHDSYKEKLLSGIAQADSVTLDIHKWMSVQMASSTFVTRHAHILEATFKTTTAYMPSKEGDAIDPYTNSIQWSRRTIGMKFFVSLLFYGWESYANLVQKQIEHGELMRNLLLESGFWIANDTLLPVICLLPSKNYKITQTKIDELISTGNVWLSLYPINNINTIRVCLTNYATTEKHIIDLVHLLKTHL